MNPKTRDAISFIESNLSRRIHVAEIAECVGLRRSRLSFLFTSEIGMAPGQFLKRVRMEKACELLESSFLGIKEIAARVGYNDDTHFMRDFKKACGLTPSQHRAEYLADQAGKARLGTKDRKIG